MITALNTKKPKITSLKIVRGFIRLDYVHIQRQASKKVPPCCKCLA